MAPDGGHKTKPRPRFAKELETPVFKLPAGKQIGSVLAANFAPNGDLYILHQGNAQGVDTGAQQSDWLPPLVHLNAKGEFLNAWGGPDHIPKVDGVSQWPAALEGLECDDDGNLWIFGYKADDDAVLKFSPDGKLLLRIGQRGKQGGDDDTQYLGGPTACHHDTKTREVFISDGYRNRRIIAFNSDTGAFTRMWGAYGKKPSSMSEAEGFAKRMHKVIRSPTGRLVVADRDKGWIQEFEVTPTEVRYIREVFIAPGTRVLNTGAAWDIAFTKDGKFMYVADGANFRVWVLDYETFAILGSTSVTTEHENEENLPIHYGVLHRFTVEPNGDLLLSCSRRGLKRLKFEGVR